MQMRTPAAIAAAAECAVTAFSDNVIIVSVKARFGAKAVLGLALARAVMGWEVSCAIWLAAIING